MPDYVVIYVPAPGKLTAQVGPNVNGTFTAASGDLANRAAAVQNQRDGKYVALSVAGATPASFTTDVGVTNANLTFTAVQAGQAGTAIRWRYVIAGNNTPLSVSVTGNDITVNLATNGTGVATSTASAIRSALNANTSAAALITTTLATGNDGTGIPLMAMPYTNLVNGSSGAAVASQVTVAMAATANDTTF